MRACAGDCSALAFDWYNRGLAADARRELLRSLQHGLSDELETVRSNARRWSGDAEGCHGAIVRIKNGRGDAAHAILDLFIVNSKLAVADALQFALQSKHIGDGV